MDNYNENERHVLLIINDQEISQKLKNSIKQKFGFNVEVSTDGNNAIMLVEQFPWKYDVVVIFDEKGEEDELLEKIKKDFPEIEIIFISDSSEKTNINGWRKGASNCFFLPINYEGVAYAVKFAREKNQLHRERKMLEKLNQLSSEINAALELNEILELTCRAAVEIFNVDHSGVVLFRKDLQSGDVIAEYPTQKKIVGKEIKIKGIPIEEKLVYDKEIIHVPDVFNFKSLKEVHTILTCFDIRSLLIVPVILNDRVIASFSLDMIEMSRIFYPDEIELCKKLANQVAIAIAKTKYLKELSILNEIGHVLGSVKYFV
jgi:ActR/RegA family two-component response regulator